ncbi:hypothetical protein E3N88_03580 [Mikania micrantha]|uniref:Uncharacterized protein n=1 Tax=Mikania micrantha TaxID=192012 RepID=A0A5N6Q6W0_9ASTR|nr:hypothetical protein E3N88_03580 [Mikania micrantha]
MAKSPNRTISSLRVLPLLNSKRYGSHQDNYPSSVSLSHLPSSFVILICGIRTIRCLLGTWGIDISPAQQCAVHVRRDQGGRRRLWAAGCAQGARDLRQWAVALCAAPLGLCCTAAVFGSENPTVLFAKLLIAI